MSENCITSVSVSFTWQPLMLYIVSANVDMQFRCLTCAPMLTHLSLKSAGTRSGDNGILNVHQGHCTHC